MQLEFSPWPGNFHKPWVWPLQKNVITDKDVLLAQCQEVNVDYQFSKDVKGNCLCNKELVAKPRNYEVFAIHIPTSCKDR